ncbi:DUF3592 domain-containing protein [Streptomyces sp. NPDC058008]|uniref:DUF3592 domain-containing protein n=1 Tax=Streptomyces sp. NPDC058008 TaxID=3346303 RepID=UPI0036E4CF4C
MHGIHIAAFLCGVIGIGLTCYAGERAILFIRGVPTEGVCVRLEWSSSTSGVKTVAEFIDADGILRTSSSGYRGGSADVGAAVKVIYDPRRPVRSEVAPLRRTEFIAVTLTAAVLDFAAVTLVLDSL